MVFKFLRKKYKECQSDEACEHYYIGLQDLGDTLYALGLYKEAKKYYDDMLFLADVKQENIAKYLREKGLSYLRLGNIAKCENDNKEAMRFYVASLEYSLKLAQSIVTLDTLRDVSICYQKIGDIFANEGKLIEARDCYEKCLEIDLDLAARWQYRDDLAVSYFKMGDIHEQLGELQEAKRYFELFMSISYSLVEETGGIKSRQNLAISYERLGNLAQLDGRMKEAYEYYKKSNSIFFNLVEEEGTVENRCNLAHTYVRLGDIVADDDICSAKEYYQKGIEICQLLIGETEEANAYRLLIILYMKLGDTQSIIAGIEKKELADEVEIIYLRALELTKHLVDSASRHGYNLLLHEVLYKLAGFYLSKDNTSKAQSYFYEALEAQPIFRIVKWVDTNQNAPSFYTRDEDDWYARKEIISSIPNKDRYQELVTFAYDRLNYALVSFEMYDKEDVLLVFGVEM